MLACAAGLAAGLAAAAPAARAEDSKVQIRSASTPHDAELIKAIPITRKAKRKPRVVMSLPLRKLGRFDRGDRLRYSSEFQVTTDCKFRSRRCAGKPYDHYDPVISSRLIIARQRFTTGGSGARSLTGWRSRVCTQQLPRREHHCVIADRWRQLRVKRLSRLPCPRDDCRINVVVAAHHPAARSHEKVVVGGNKPDGQILQDRGRISVLRLRGPGKPDRRRFATRERRRKKLPLDGRLRVIYSQPVPVRPGDVVAVGGKLRTKIDRLPYDVRTGAQLIAARSPHATKPRGFAKRGVTMRGEVDERNGFNCTLNMPGCRLDKYGMVKVRERWRKLAGDRPLYVNLLAQTNPKRARAASGHRVAVSAAGRLWVDRYRSAKDRERDDHR